MVYHEQTGEGGWEKKGGMAVRALSVWADYHCLSYYLRLCCEYHHDTHMADIFTRQPVFQVLRHSNMLRRLCMPNNSGNNEKVNRGKNPPDPSANTSAHSA